jgi:hypothetical protein
MAPRRAAAAAAAAPPRPQPEEPARHAAALGGAAAVVLAAMRAPATVALPLGMWSAAHAAATPQEPCSRSQQPTTIPCHLPQRTLHQPSPALLTPLHACLPQAALGCLSAPGRCTRRHRRQCSHNGGRHSSGRHCAARPPQRNPLKWGSCSCASCLSPCKGVRRRASVLGLSTQSSRDAEHKVIGAVRAGCAGFGQLLRPCQAARAPFSAGAQSAAHLSWVRNETWAWRRGRGGGDNTGILWWGTINLASGVRNLRCMKGGGGRRAVAAVPRALCWRETLHLSNSALA